jgi:aspartyl aminopeptidase
MTDPVLDDLLAFVREAPTPFHAVDATARRLTAARFVELGAAAPWEGLAGGRYFVIHGGTSLIAFVVPSSRKLDGFRIVGAHTDSPNLRLKPKPEYAKEGYAQLGVEVYGGALLSSWLDRDLSLAGRVFVRDGSAPTGVVPRLLRIDRPLLRVPQLAIHLDRDVNDKGLVLNKQEHLAPVIGLAEGHEGLHALAAKELGVAKDDVAALELMLYDVTPPSIAGARGEFVFSARLDNLAMCHAATRALADAAPKADAGAVVPVMALFDHEEIGSESATGAHSAFLPHLLERVGLAMGASREAYLRALVGSSCVSADMAHAVHPNYAERHEARHKPVLDGGPVIKVNAQQRYATSAATAAKFAELCRLEDVPVQHYTNRTDLPCGSTIGPITSTLLGIETVDVGNAMLSMHSIREMTGAKDPERMTRVLARYFA